MNSKTVLALFCGLTMVGLVSAVVLGRHVQSANKYQDIIRRFEVQGTIRAVDVANKTIRIAHEEIPDYMPAMTMPFTVKDIAVLRNVAAGDRVQFQLAVTRDDSWIARIERIPSEPTTAKAATTVGSPGELEAEQIKTGEAVPDFTLMDQEGHTFRLSDFRGKAVLLTFIYTRCPLPNFCPLMTKNFAELEQRLRKEFAGKYQLLSISMDPEFDRPEVLKDYATRYNAQRDWTFATGDADSIRFVAGLMGLSYAKENGLISHDLRTALIDPKGKLVHLWKSNVWTPYEVQRRVRETLTGSEDVAVR
jgi:protein SCO1